jgi:hypothetical protein
MHGVMFRNNWRERGNDLSFISGRKAIVQELIMEYLRLFKHPPAFPEAQLLFNHCSSCRSRWICNEHLRKVD